MTPLLISHKALQPRNKGLLHRVLIQCRSDKKGKNKKLYTPLGDTPPPDLQIQLPINNGLLMRMIHLVV